MTESLDPRPAAIARTTAGIGRIVAVTGSKGGIGKSIVSAGLALAIAQRGSSAGLFDLDFTSPTAHVILGAELRFPDEEYGVDPLTVDGVKLMSVALFSGDAPAPLRGSELTQALLELLAVTRWGETDILILDLPPGLSDVSLDLIRFLPRTELLLLGTASRLVIESVRRALALAVELSLPLLGIAENMRRRNDDAVEHLADAFSVPFLGSIPFDPTLEDVLGDLTALRAGDAYRGIARIAAGLFERPGR